MFTDKPSVRQSFTLPSHPYIKNITHHPAFFLEDRSTVLFSLIKFQYVVPMFRLLFLVAYVLDEVTFLLHSVPLKVRAAQLVLNH